MRNIGERVGAEDEGKKEGMSGGDGSRMPPRDGEGQGDADADKRAADSAFDDLVIEVDESELEAELNDQPPGRKY